MKILFLINDINYFVSHRLDLVLNFKEKGFIPIIVLGRSHHKWIIINIVK